MEFRCQQCFDAARREIPPLEVVGGVVKCGGVLLFEGGAGVLRVRVDVEVKVKAKAQAKG